MGKSMDQVNNYKAEVDALKLEIATLKRDLKKAQVELQRVESSNSNLKWRTSPQVLTRLKDAAKDKVGPTMVHVNSGRDETIWRVVLLSDLQEVVHHASPNHEAESLALSSAPPDWCLEVFKILRGYPDFDEGGPFADMLDEAMKGERPKLLGEVNRIAQGLVPVETVTKTTEAALKVWSERAFDLANDVLDNAYGSGCAQKSQDCTPERRGELERATDKAIGRLRAEIKSVSKFARMEPTFGVIDPDYARIFTIARCLAWGDGYSACVQGSFTRDLDLLLVPWTDDCRHDPQHIVNQLAEVTGLSILHNKPPTVQPHGRLSWTLVFPGFGDPRFVDISAFSPIPKESKE